MQCLIPSWCTDIYLVQEENFRIRQKSGLTFWQHIALMSDMFIVAKQLVKGCQTLVMDPTRWHTGIATTQNLEGYVRFRFSWKAPHAGSFTFWVSAHFERGRVSRTASTRLRTVFSFLWDWEIPISFASSSGTSNLQRGIAISIFMGYLRRNR